MATLKDIARESGFSIGTVSKVLNARHGEQSFSRECIRRIRAAARELGYRPNYHARSLQGGRSQTIGVLIGNLNQCSYDHFWSQMIGGIMVHAREMGFHSLAVGELEGRSPFELGMRFLEERRVDALIALPTVSGAGVPCPYEELPGPAVLTAYERASDWPTVALDEAAGIASAVRHLAQLGHRHVLWVGPRDHADPSVGRRRAAFDEAAATLDLRTDAALLAYEKGEDAESFGRRVAMQREGMLAFLDGGCPATGWICYEETTALGALAACAARGLRVPDDVSVVGFDDIYAQAAWPPMTVVSHMLESMGRRAAELAVDAIENGAAGEVQAGYAERIAAELVVRASTGPAPA